MAAAPCLKVLLTSPELRKRRSRRRRVGHLAGVIARRTADRGRRSGPTPWSFAAQSKRGPKRGATEVSVRLQGACPQTRPRLAAEGPVVVSKADLGQGAARAAAVPKVPDPRAAAVPEVPGSRGLQECAERWFRRGAGARRRAPRRRLDAERVEAGKVRLWTPRRARGRAKGEPRRARGRGTGASEGRAFKLKYIGDTGVIETGGEVRKFDVGVRR